ncbi:DUF4158 domain-containing protein [Streptomyces microflavus]|uniref:DUF4158 domain-containing protein n=1 Tax=Streptomyces microflavus TaxID=1919 RepID=UPI0038042B23
MHRWLRNKSGATRLGFAVQMKFLLWRGRFPKIRLELPRDAVEHVARQVGVDAGELAAYGFTSCVTPYVTPFVSRPGPGGRTGWSPVQAPERPGSPRGTRTARRGPEEPLSALPAVLRGAAATGRRDKKF